MLTVLLFAVCYISFQLSLVPQREQLGIKGSPNSERDGEYKK